MITGIVHMHSKPSFAREDLQMELISHSDSHNKNITFFEMTKQIHERWFVRNARFDNINWNVWNGIANNCPSFKIAEHSSIWGRVLLLPTGQSPKTPEVWELVWKLPNGKCWIHMCNECNLRKLLLKNMGLCNNWRCLKHKSQCLKHNYSLCL